MYVPTDPAIERRTHSLPAHLKKKKKKICRP
jgi:hypothetical protein